MVRVWDLVGGSVGTGSCSSEGGGRSGIGGGGAGGSSSSSLSKPLSTAFWLSNVPKLLADICSLVDVKVSVFK